MYFNREMLIILSSSLNFRTARSARMQETNQSDSESAELCASYLKALGDPTRLQVVRALQTGPLSVTDIALLLEIEVANVSHHLRVLFHADLVTTERSGKFIYYKLNGEFWKNRSVAKTLDFGCCKIDLRD